MVIVLHGGKGHRAVLVNPSGQAADPFLERRQVSPVQAGGVAPALSPGPVHNLLCVPGDRNALAVDMPAFIADGNRDIKRFFLFRMNG